MFAKVLDKKRLKETKRVELSPLVPQLSFQVQVDPNQIGLYD